MSSDNFSNLRQKEEELMNINKEMDEKNEQIKQRMQALMAEKRDLNFSNFGNLDADFEGIDQGYENIQDSQVRFDQRRPENRFGKFLIFPYVFDNFIFPL
jgi:predicted nuclease with TOPRIM domain